MKTKNIFIGVLCGIIVMVLLAIVTGYVLFKLDAYENNCYIPAKIICGVGGLTAGFVTGKLSDKNKFLKGIISGLVLYIIITVIFLLLKTGNLKTIGIRCGIICITSLFGGMLSGLKS